MYHKLAKIECYRRDLKYLNILKKKKNAEASVRFGKQKPAVCISYTYIVHAKEVEWKRNMFDILNTYLIQGISLDFS